MLGINLTHSLATVAVAAGLLVAYNGHAGLGLSVYQHNQTDLEFLASVRGQVLMTDMGGQFY